MSGIIRDDEEITATVDALPQEPPKDALETAKKRIFAERLVYRVGWRMNPENGKKEKCVLARCTACKAETEMKYVRLDSGEKYGFIGRDGDTCRNGILCACPVCGVNTYTLRAAYINGRDTDIGRYYFMTLHNVRGHMAMLSWVVFKSCGKDAEIYWSTERYEGYITVGRVPVRVTGYQKNMYCGTTWFHRWQARRAYTYTGDRWGKDEILLLDRRTLDETDGEKSAMDVFIENGGTQIAEYIRLWTKYPNVENLVRSGYTGTVSAIIEACKETSGYYYRETDKFKIDGVRRYIKPKKAKPHEMLGLEKAELPMLSVHSLDAICVYRLAKEQGVRLTERQIETAEEIGADRIYTLCKSTYHGFAPKVLRVLNYLEKRKNSFGTLSDYWRMTENVYGEIPPEMAYPKDLKKMHDRMMLLQKEKTERETDEKIRRFAKDLAWMSFSDPELGLEIHPCGSQEEIIKEGKILGHCVATYAQRVADRETSILMIRETKEPDMPFFTLEYKGGSVIQNRGNKNRDRTKEVRIFEEKWLTYIRREGKKHGNDRAEKQRAGA